MSTRLWRWNRHIVPKRRLLNTTRWRTTRKITRNISLYLRYILILSIYQNSRLQCTGDANPKFHLYENLTSKMLNSNGITKELRLDTRQGQQVLFFKKLPEGLGTPPSLLFSGYLGFVSPRLNWKQISILRSVKSGYWCTLFPLTSVLAHCAQDSTVFSL
jgi:hypothetical protein